MLLTIKDVKEVRDYLISELKKFSEKHPSISLGYFPEFFPSADETSHMIVYPDAALKEKKIRESFENFRATIKNPAWGIFTIRESNAEKINTAPYQFLNGKMTKKTVRRAAGMPVV